ncbi:MAG: Tetratricopeptide 2 repeat protein [Chthonomonadaceae bacterium]|nr:Tetratricopeptide 2 repeat protein [Chthonomonadaceae bacterium]
MRPFLLCLPAVLLMATGCSHRTAPVALRASLAATRPAYDPTLLPKTMAFHEKRLKETPHSAIELNFLAANYNQLCRETGDIADTFRAEQLARRSLKVRTHHNDPAYYALANSLFTQHRFRESLAIGKYIAARSADDLQAAYLIVENQTELGDYAEAEKTLQGAHPHLDDPFGMALRARLLEMNGQMDAARTQLERARDAAAQNIDIPRENLAWFCMRVGDLHAAQGRVKQAEQSYHEALELFPNDQRTLTALTRLSAARGDWAATLSWGRRAANIVPTPEVVALLGDAYRVQGKTQEADAQYALLETMHRLDKAQGGVYDRQRALYLADHDRGGLDEALLLARKELTVRHDVYAYDTLAWACCRKGLYDEAAKAIDTALAHNSKDARLLYHAGIIAAKRGENPKAKQYLTQALATNPYFLPFAPTQARSALTTLGG